MPIGYLTSVVVVALYTAIILRAPRRPAGVARATFVTTHWVNEYPFIALAALAAVTVPVLARGDLTSAGGWVLFGVAVVTALGLLRVVQRAWSAGAVVQSALADGLPDAWPAGRAKPPLASATRSASKRQ